MKKLVVLAAIIVAAVTSQAAYLQWQIEDMTVKEDWTTANLYWRSTGEGEAKGEVISQLNNQGSGTTFAEMLDISELTDQNTHAFYVELVNSKNEVVGLTTDWTSQTYSSLAAQGMIGSSMSELPTAIWHGGSVGAPEPTSAMLMLLGVAGLALKRKQKKA